ncbi:hypothetical protein O3M35_007824 [Rhynocoris fuscipes]|uniref:Uncharacterized protein n=1 Tax=Rhynocoris fuscipes TaxID=488301 RepID=A0AAW1DCB1_9HEMI
MLLPRQQLKFKNFVSTSFLTNQCCQPKHFFFFFFFLCNFIIKYLFLAKYLYKRNNFNESILPLFHDPTLGPYNESGK